MMPGATIPPRADAPPASPYERLVASRPVLDVTGATAALAVGPDDVLVVTFPSDYADEDVFPGGIADLRNRFLDVLPPGRFLIVFADGVEMSTVHSPADPGRSYTHPVLGDGRS